MTATVKLTAEELEMVRQAMAAKFQEAVKEGRGTVWREAKAKLDAAK